MKLERDNWRRTKQNFKREGQREGERRRWTKRERLDQDKK